jgi:succinoglycan biosynthesis transport protein ExoP
MELRQYFNVLWKWMWLIVMAVLIAASASYLASRAATPLYRTRSTLLVGPGTQSANLNTYDFYLAQQLAQTYAQLARREPVLKGVIQSLGLKRHWSSLAGQVNASAVPNSQLLEISVVDSDPYRAKVIADAVAQQLILLSPTNPSSMSPEEIEFTEAQLNDLQKKIEESSAEIDRLKQELDATNSARQIQSINNQISLQESKITNWQYTYSQLALTRGGSSNTLSILEEATVSTNPISPNIQMNVLMASALGLVLAVGGAFLVEYLDDTVKTPEDAVNSTNLPLLGAIARIEGDNYAEMLVAAHHPLSPIVEACRVLRTNIQFSTVDHPANTLMVTSPGPSEGKSVLIANLAVVIAQSGNRVILVDTDLRRPVQHRIFSLPNRNGLSDSVLHPVDDIRERLQDTGIANLQLLSSGSLPPNPAELLGSERMGLLIEELKKHADTIIFDSPPVLVVADAAILGSKLDGVILVNDSGNTRTVEARRAVEELRRGRVNLLGVVLNRMPLGGRGSYYYYNYSYYVTDKPQKSPKSNQKRATGKMPPINQAQDKPTK